MRTAIYTRISEDDGSALGVKRQEDDARAEAARRGWEVVGVYPDNDVSATRSKVRPQYQRLLEDIRSGHVQAIVVWDIDRLTRTPREIEDVIDLAEQTGLVLVNIGGTEDIGTSDGRMMLRIKASLARRETEQMSKRLKRKFLEKAQSGQPHGRAPYGYTRVGGLDVVVESQAAVIRESAERILAGESLRSIGLGFDARGIAGPGGGKWNSTILRQLVIRPSNAGLRQYRGKVIGKAQAEGILTEDDHARLVALLTDPSRKQNQVGPTPKYLLSNIALCGRCGGGMRRQIGKTVTLASGAIKRQPPSYQCSVCHKVRRVQEPVDALVEEVIVRRLADPVVARHLFASGNPEAALKAQAEIATIDAKLGLAADQFAADDITGDQLKRITARLRGDRQNTEARLHAATSNDRLAAFTSGDVRAKWEAAPIAAKREVTEALVTITIQPSGPGKRFDPELIEFSWRG